MLSTFLCLGLPSGLLTSGFPTNILYAVLFTHSRYIPCPSHPPSSNCVLTDTISTGFTMQTYLLNTRPIELLISDKYNIGFLFLSLVVNISVG
jgi:hypothetical protein